MKNEYDPSRDLGRPSYRNWGKASDMGGLTKTSSSTSRLSDAEIKAYREYMAKEGSESLSNPIPEKTRLRRIEENVESPGIDGEIMPGVEDKLKTQGNESVQVSEDSQGLMSQYADRRKHEKATAETIPTDVKINRRELDVPDTLSKYASEEAALLKDDDVNPIVLMRLLNEMWGDEWLDWEPETIMETSPVEISGVNMGKIFAIRVLLKTERGLEEPRIFEKICIAFSNRVVDWGIVQKPLTHEIAGTIALIDKYIGFDGVSEEVATYIAAVALNDGYVLLPAVLSFADPHFSAEIALTMGGEALKAQEKIMAALESDSDDPPNEYVPQYLRALRCQYHAQQRIEEAR